MLRTKLKEELFKFKKHPKITKEINEVLKQYYNSLLYTIESGTAKEWDFANEKMNAVQTLQLQRIASKVPREVLVSELAKISKSPHNYEALKSFQQRKIGDFTISERVWKITEQMRDELEFAIDVSLADGKSANQLAREIKKYLNEPDRLYRRVRDKHGNLVLSQNAKNFHPGQGIYRSSHKNALRLAKEEINTAYRESEQLRIMQNNDVVGIEIKLSPSHKIYDICDELKGRYPKDFKWSKWHIGCMCHRLTILKSDEEFIKELQNGENLPPESSKNFVSDVPKNFTQWVEDNEDRFKNWKRKPNFLEENKKYWREDKKILNNNQKEYRKRLQKQAIDKFSGKIIDNNGLKIKITTKGIKEFINQPHKDYFAKNELVKDLPNIIKNSKYLGYTEDYIKNKDVLKSHILEVGKLKSWFIVREMKNNDVIFYSITDSEDILKHIKK